METLIVGGIALLLFIYLFVPWSVPKNSKFYDSKTPLSI